MASLTGFNCYSNGLYTNEEDEIKRVIAKLSTMMADHGDILKTGDRYDQAESMDAIFNTLVENGAKIPDWTVEKLWKRFRSQVARNE